MRRNAACRQYAVADAPRFSPDRGHADVADMHGIGRLGLLLLAAVPACAPDAEPAAAAAVFTAFQDALHRADEEGCRRLLTVESAQALADMPWQSIRARQLLGVLGAHREGNEFRVAVTDPNADGKAGEFVVVCEHGKLVVDLVASAGLTAEVVEAAHAEDRFEPRALTPADFDRIRQHELATPPGR